jgi:hypothetical protein
MLARSRKNLREPARGGARGSAGLGMARRLLPHHRMGPHSILVLDLITLAVASVLHRRYPQAAYEDVGLLVLIGALMLVFDSTTPGLVISAVGWAALAIKTARH